MNYDTNAKSEEGNGEEKPPDDVGEFRAMKELGSLLHLSVPSVATQFGMYFLYPQAASIVGRSLGTEALAGFSLGSLVGNLTCLSVIVGALTAADTLMPRAFGSGNYREVGLLAIRGIFVCVLLLTPPVIILCTSIDKILIGLGQDPVASTLAAQWIRYYLLGIPPNLAFRVMQRFLVSQHCPWPAVYAGLVPCILVHPFLLNCMVPKWGLEGSAIAVCCTQWITLLLLFLYLRFNPVYHHESWPGMTRGLFKEAFSVAPCLAFFRLSLGGVLSLSEWWFWETMVVIAGSFGITALCAHTIAYNIIPLLAMIPLGTSIGLSVRMGNVIGKSVKRAQQIAILAMCFILVTGVLMSYVIWRYRYEIVGLFTLDQEVIDACERIWLKVCCYVVILYTFFINSAILRSLGMQWRVAAVVLLCLWCLLLPTVVWWSMIQGGGLESEWTLFPIFHALMQVMLTYSYLTTDWRAKSGAHSAGTASEESALLGSGDESI